MKRRGHQGVVLLALAGMLALLLPERPLIALLALGVVVIEPLPDYDQRISWLEHRKTSHSFLSAALIGGLCGAVGWLAGTYALEPLARMVVSTPITDDPTGLSWWAARFVALDAERLAAVGLWVGAGGVLLHMVGDILTKGGLQPFLPFSRRWYRISPLAYDNRIANTGLFVLGIVAIVAVVLSLLGVPSLF